MREAISFCRICSAQCGVVATIGEDGRINSVRGDRQNPLTAGYACIKGVDSGAMHSRADRVLRPLKRLPDGRMVEISLDQATAEVAERLNAIIARDGPEAIALYAGTASFANATLTKILPSFMAAIGSPNRYSPLTIDSSSRVVSAVRLGTWAAGRQRFDTSNVWMMFGINPLISPRNNGVPPFNPMKRFKAGKARGMQVIVVDPRRTETAHYADLFLPVRPGEDAALAAGMLRIILDEGLHDRAFCAEFVDGIDRLRAAIDPFTPDYVAARADLSAGHILAAAHMFAGPGKRGCADPGTGITMSPFSNLADHLVELLNVVCGRFVRAGERVANPVPLRAHRPVRAEVVRPPRWWESGKKMRAGGYGMLFTEDGGEFPTAALADEILLPGKGQIRALLSVGGNPASAFPDQSKVHRALKSLELLVAVEPFLGTTARLADYVIPPRLMYERADLQKIYGEATRIPIPFTQYAKAIVDPPADSDVAEEWLFIWDLARRMGLQLIMDGQALDMEAAPTSDALLDLITAGGQVTLDEVRGHPHGQVFEMEQYVEPARPELTARFDAMPPDVAEELELYRAATREHVDFPYRLTVRRMRQALNSAISAPEKLDPKKRFNPAYMHSSELAALGLRPGDRIAIQSDTGRLTGIVEADDGLRPGIVSMSHLWGGLPDDPGDPFGAACTSILVNTARSEKVNAMPAMTAIPVRITPLRSSGGEGRND